MKQTAPSLNLCELSSLTSEDKHTMKTFCFGGAISVFKKSHNSVFMAALALAIHSVFVGAIVDVPIILHHSNTEMYYTRSFFITTKAQKYYTSCLCIRCLNAMLSDQKIILWCHNQVQIEDFLKSVGRGYSQYMNCHKRAA